MFRYDYFRPKSLEEAHRIAGDIPDAIFIAGGTDLVVQMRKRRVAAPPALISLRNVQELTAIEVRDDTRIGAGALLADLERHPVLRDRYPALVSAIEALGSRQIRNVATLGGNLCNASPAADTAPPLLVYDARIEISGPGGSREIPIDSLFVGPGRTVLERGEILTAIVLPPPATSAHAAFSRKGRVRMDLAIVIVSVLIEMTDSTCTRARVAVGSVAPVPMRLNAVEQLLQGTQLDDEKIAQARQLVASGISPITDVRSSADYRRTLTGVLFERVTKQLLAEARS